jgi:hypothetical protein
MSEDREKDNYEIWHGRQIKNITNTGCGGYMRKDRVYYISDRDTCCYFLYEMDAEGNNKKK